MLWILHLPSGSKYKMTIVVNFVFIARDKFKIHNMTKLILTYLYQDLSVINLSKHLLVLGTIDSTLKYDLF